MRERAEKLAIASSLALTIAPSFFFIAAFNTDRSVPPPRWLVTPFDNWVPLVPRSAWLYVSWYVAPMLIWFTDRFTYRRLCGAILAAFLVCIVGYVGLPVRMVRPVLEPRDGASVALLILIYEWDPPVNIFPSFHAAVASILIQVPLQARAPRLLVFTWMSAILVACVTTKQHYVLDVVFGAFVGTLSHYVVKVIQDRFPPSRVR